MDLRDASATDLKARPKPFTFYPPKTNRLVIGVVKLLIRRSIRRKLRVTEIEISDDDLSRLREFKGERCLVTPSHSGGFEPHVIMYLSKLLRDEYNYVAAVELFEQSPLRRWLMPRLGVYSIVRGAVDRPSFSMTRELLAAGRRWLVIFPEGHTIWQNSTVIPFQEGVIQLAFKGYEDAAKAEPEAHLYCIPIAIKYIYLKSMYAEIDESLTRLEAKLAVDVSATELSRYARPRRIAEAVLVANEKAKQVTLEPGQNLASRSTLRTTNPPTAKTSARRSVRSPQFSSPRCGKCWKLRKKTVASLMIWRPRRIERVISAKRGTALVAVRMAVNCGPSISPCLKWTRHKCRVS